LSPRIAFGWIIPAYAGSTCETTGESSREPDHPRIRGEHSPAHRRRRRPGGSSPHTRGARPQRPQVIEQARIIPAYAGSTDDSDQYSIDGLGSSPHTRGARWPQDPLG